MTRSVSIAAATAALLLLASAPACVTDEEDVLDDSAAELSVWSWSARTYVGDTKESMQLATLGNTTYMVSTAPSSRELYWRKRNADGTWTAAVAIPGQRTKDAPSLAAFNGYLYMVHLGDPDSNLWYSRFDPATETWGEQALLPYWSIQAPALAAFDNRLFIVGTDIIENGFNPMWVGTMSASETFTTAVGLSRRMSSTQPSLAVLANKLYMTHQNGTNPEIMFSVHNAGAAPHLWSTPSFIRAGQSGLPIRGEDATIAAVNGYLHLVHKKPGGNLTFWTYFNRCTWAPEVGLDSFVNTAQHALTTSSEGLVMARGSVGPILKSFEIHTSAFTAPPPPEALPQCQGAI